MVCIVKCNYFRQILEIISEDPPLDVKNIWYDKNFTFKQIVFTYILFIILLSIKLFQEEKIFS